jgi:O-antigen/teichoic acid export membrane protein
MNPLRKLAGDTAIYGLSSIIGRLLNYLLVPFYTSILLPVEYGVITEFYAYIAFLNILYAYGMETAFLKFAAEGSLVEIGRTTSSLLLFTSTLLSGVLVCLATPLINGLGYPGHEAYVYYIAAILWVDTLLLIPFARLRLLNQASRFAKLKCAQIGVNILLNVLFLYIFPQIAVGKLLPAWQPVVSYLHSLADRIAYVFLANVLANLSVLPWMKLSLTDCPYHVDRKQVSRILRYSIPLLVVGLAGMTNEMLSRVLLKHLLPIDLYPGQSKEAILGVFGACYKLSIFMALGIQAFRYAAEPFFFSHAADRESPQLFSKVMQAYILIACWIWFAISANLDLLGLVFLRQPAYRTGIEIVPYLTLAYLWLGIYYNLSIWFKLVNKTYYGSIITVIGALVNVFLNLILVPQWGYMGSVWATLCSYVSMVAICYYQGQKHYPIPYPIGRGLLIICLTWGLVLIVRKLNSLHMTYVMVSNMVCTLVYGWVVYRWVIR